MSLFCSVLIRFLPQNSIDHINFSGRPNSEEGGGGGEAVGEDEGGGGGGGEGMTMGGKAAL